MVGTLTTEVRLKPDATYAAGSVQVITDTAAFLALEGEWNDAVARARVPHPFLTHEWMRTWWECFGGDAELHMVVVRERGRIVAIAPLMRETARMYGIPVRMLRLMQNDHTPRADILIAERPDHAYRAIWSVLVAERDQWDVLQLGQIPRDSDTGGMIQELANADGMATGTWASGAAPYLELTGTWDSYFASLSSKFRSNVRNRLTRLTQIGVPALEVLEHGAAVLTAREDLMRLEASGWKEREGTAINSDPSVHRFYALLSERATAAGWLRLLFLRVNDRRIATSYGSVYDGRLFLFKTGYDPEFAKCSPFKVLTSLAVQHAYAHGLREVDFLGDSEPWKLEWTSTTRAHDWLFVFGTSARARLVNRAKFQLAPAVRRWREY